MATNQAHKEELAMKYVEQNMKQIIGMWNDTPCKCDMMLAVVQNGDTFAYKLIYPELELPTRQYRQQAKATMKRALKKHEIPCVAILEGEHCKNCKVWVRFTIGSKS